MVMARTDKPNCSALTLLEVVVVLAIIAVIAALILPAIFAARGAALHIDCSNRLRQLGLALQNYSGDWGCFPPRLIVSPGVLPPPGPWGSHVCLLPYLEQGNVYNALNHVLFNQDAANATVTSMSLSVFLCPSDAIPTAFKYGFANYAACVGSGLFPDGLDAKMHSSMLVPDDGLFFGLRGVKPSECTDGLSYTAALSEIIHGGSLVGTAPNFPPPPTPGLEYTFSPFTPPTQRKLIELCTGLDSSSSIRSADPVGTAWVTFVTYTHLLSPNQPRCWGPGGDAFSAMTASSRHPGMVHVVFGDGHVSAIPNSIDLEIWRALGSRNKGEVIDRTF